MKYFFITTALLGYFSHVSASELDGGDQFDWHSPIQLVYDFSGDFNTETESLMLSNLEEENKTIAYVESNEKRPKLNMVDAKLPKPEETAAFIRILIDSSNN